MSNPARRRGRGGAGPISPGSPSAAQPAAMSASSGSQSPVSAPQTGRLTDPARDPANRPRLTDTVRNVDLPATFYNMNDDVSLVC